MDDIYAFKIFMHRAVNSPIADDCSGCFSTAKRSSPTSPLRSGGAPPTVGSQLSISNARAFVVVLCTRVPGCLQPATENQHTDTQKHYTLGATVALTDPIRPYESSLRVRRLSAH